MRYVDFAYGRPGGANIRAAGFPGLFRYLSKTVKKNLDRTEFEDYKANNLLVHVVYQDGIADHNGGIEGGSTNAIRAKTQLKELGWDGSSGCIYFAPLDANETSGTVSLTLDYFRGIRNQLPKNNIGVYGDADTINAIRQADLANYFWQSASKSFGPDVDCNVRQLAQQTTINGVIVDINNVFTGDTGAITGGIANMPTELETYLGNCTANGFASFADMFKIDTPESRGIVSLLRFLFNNSARSDQLGLVGVNVNEARGDIAELKALIQAIAPPTMPEIDTQMLARQIAQALIQEIKAL